MQYEKRAQCGARTIDVGVGGLSSVLRLEAVPSLSSRTLLQLLFLPLRAAYLYTDEGAGAVHFGAMPEETPYPVATVRNNKGGFAGSPESATFDTLRTVPGVVRGASVAHSASSCQLPLSPTQFLELQHNCNVDPRKILILILTVRVK